MVYVWKKWTYRVTVVQGITEFFQGVQELDVVPSLVGEVRDSPVVLLPLLQQTNPFNKISLPNLMKKVLSLKCNTGYHFETILQNIGGFLP